MTAAAVILWGSQRILPYPLSKEHVFGLNVTMNDKQLRVQVFERANELRKRKCDWVLVMYLTQAYCDVGLVELILQRHRR